MTKFQLYKIQTDCKEENDLAAQMPEKTAEMKATLLKTWKGIEAEGPRQWWEKAEVQPNLKKRGYRVAY